MFPLNSLSVGEQLAAAKDEARLKSAVIGALMMRLGVTELDLDLDAWIDADDCALVVTSRQYSPLVGLKIEPVLRLETKEPPAWIRDVLGEVSQ